MKTSLRVHFSVVVVAVAGTVVTAVMSTDSGATSLGLNPDPVAYCPLQAY